MPVALFILGHAGSGKTKTAKRFIRSRLKQGEAWALLDKDTTGAVLAPALLEALGLDPLDRDSPAYQAKVRDLEYAACLTLAAEQLKLGINVVLPGPWSKELAQGTLFDNKALGFPGGTRLVHVYLEVPVATLRARIEERADPRDAWKLQHWDTYAVRLGQPLGVSQRRLPILNKGPVKEQNKWLARLCRKRA